jgi:hypothetical protein
MLPRTASDMLQSGCSDQAASVAVALARVAAFDVCLAALTVGTTVGAHCDAWGGCSGHLDSPSCAACTTRRRPNPNCCALCGSRTDTTAEAEGDAERTQASTEPAGTEPATVTEDGGARQQKRKTRRQDGPLTDAEGTGAQDVDG